MSLTFKSFPHEGIGQKKDLEKWAPLPDYYPHLIRLMPWLFLLLS